MGEVRRIEILGDKADQHKATALILAKTLPTALSGGITGNLMLPPQQWALFNQLDGGYRRFQNGDGVEVLYKSIQVAGVPFIKLHLTALA